MTNPYITTNDAVPIFIIFLILEYIYNNSKIRINDSICSICQGIMSLILFSYASKWVQTYPFQYLRYYKIIDLQMNFISSFLLLILVDLCYYWAHRCSHMISIMWAVHEPHHSSEEYNLSTAFRQSSLENLVFWIFYLPLVLFFPVNYIWTYRNINLIYQFFVHTQSPKLHPYIEFIFNTPSYHRVHHARNKKYIDKNFGGMFILWDRLFGTFMLEEEIPIFGVVTPIKTFNPWLIQFNALIKLLKIIINVPGINLKFKVLFGPPGIDYDFDNKTIYYHEIPNTIDETNKFNPDTKPYNLYIVILHTILLLSILTFEQTFYWTIFMLLEIYIISSLLENKFQILLSLISIPLFIYLQKID